MPGKLRPLSGSEVVGILTRFGFALASQRGSHAKLKRIGPTGARETLVVPLHQELDKGTIRAILRQASRFISEDELRRQFYAE